MFQRIAFCLFLLVGLTVNVKTADAAITGKVTNLAGNAIPNASLTLVGKQMTTTSGTDGTYTFNTTDITTAPSIRPKSTSIALDKNTLKFSLQNSSQVNVEIFDIKGNLIKKEVKQNAQAGYYTFNVLENAGSTKLLVIRASIGQHVAMFNYLPLKNSHLTNSSVMDKATEITGTLAQLAAVIDTVKATATGYAAKSTPVTSYDAVLNIVLTDAGALTVNLDQARQVIDGWGINNNWKELGDGGISACYDSVNGLGLNILRIGMNENGAVMSGSADISKARNRGAKIIGSTWSPPASYKTNNSINDGGHLKTANYDQWATTIANFAKSNNLYSMSLGNEADFASCGSVEPCNGNYPTTLYTAEEMVAFIKVLGPKMRSAAPNCKIMAPEASEWIHTWSDTSGCCSTPGNKPSSDPLKCGCFTGKTTPCSCAPGKGYSYGKYLYEDKAAWAYVDILGVHQYDTQRSVPWPDYVAVADRRPVWQTEMSGVKWWPDGTPSTTIENGIAVAGWIHDALTVGEMNAWCFWWYNGGSGTNEGLLLEGQDTKRHYTFGNYTKYVRPGMTRVVITGAVPANILLTAFKGTGNKVVIVAINKGTASATVPISIAGGTAPASMTPIVTSSSENWASKTALPVSNGTFTATLAGTTVTTFVSK
jgi:glucuronoarabinoxylan endo-1,4-beta-xylanase